MRSINGHGHNEKARNFRAFSIFRAEYFAMHLLAIVQNYPQFPLISNKFRNFWPVRFQNIQQSLRYFDAFIQVIHDLDSI